MSNNIADEPAFKWWVPHTMRKADAIAKAVIKRLRATRTKFGLKIPSSLEECKEFDKENGNTYWMDAWQKEIKTVKVAFEVLKSKKQIPKEFTEAKGFMIFDIKMDFTRKARQVKSGHLTQSTGELSYAGVVARDSVQIALTYAALNDLDVTMGDIKGAYLSAPTSEKHWILLGPEFGEDAGKHALIICVLYGGKHAGRDYWLYL